TPHRCPLMRATALPSTRTATGDSNTVRLRLLICLNAKVGSPMPHSPQRTYLIAFWSRLKQSSQIASAPNGSDQSLNSGIVGKREVIQTGSGRLVPGRRLLGSKSRSSGDPEPIKSL